MAGPALDYILRREENSVTVGTLETQGAGWLGRERRERREGWFERERERES